MISEGPGVHPRSHPVVVPRSQDDVAYAVLALAVLAVPPVRALRHETG